MYAADGQPVEGAVVGVERILRHGNVARSLFRGLHNEARTSEDGTVKSGRSWYREDTPRDVVFAIGAYHETFGTAYAEYTLEELESTELALTLDAGQSVSTLTGSQ